MKFYSQITNQLFNSEAELNAAEAKFKEAELKKKIEAEKAEKAAKAMKAERAARAKEVENAFKEANEAQAKATKLLRNFTKDYGYFHMSYSTDDNEQEENTIPNFFNLLTSFLN